MDRTDEGSLEYELRFGIAAADVATCEALPLLKAAPGPLTSNLSNRYFDTADFLLSESGCSLRIRDNGKGLKQTLKMPAGHGRVRHELERDVTSTNPHLSQNERKYLPAKLRRELEKQELRPVFTTTYRRMAWTVKHGESTIEMALDRGAITAGTRQALISEVELELKSGKEAEVLAFAMELCRVLPLALGAETKSERGARLAREEQPAKRLAKDVKLSSKLSCAAAFGKLSEEALDHYLGNLDAARTLAKPEPIHQMRVALRRLWAVLWAFRPIAAREKMEELSNLLKLMIGRFSAARSMDVFKAEILPRALGSLTGEAERNMAMAAASDQAAAAHHELMYYLASSEHALHVLRVYALLGEVRQSLEGAEAERLKTLAAKRLDKLHRRLAKAHIPAPESKAFHRLRLLLKRQRYIAQAFAPLFSAKSDRAYIKKLAKLQSAFGEIHDIVASRAEIEKLDLPAGISRKLKAWRKHRLREDNAHLSRLQQKLAAEKRFW